MSRLSRSNALEEKRKKIRGTIVKGMSIHDYNNSDISNMLGCSLSTFKNRKRYPEKFTLSQVWTLSKVLHFSEDEVREFTGG